MQAVPGPNAPPSGGDPPWAPPRNPRRRAGARVGAALVFAAILGGATTLGIVTYRFEIRAARTDLQRKTLAVGRLKAGEISHWLQERREDVSAAATGPRIADEVERWRARGQVDPATLRWMKQRLGGFRSHGDYLEVAILAPDGSLLLAAGDAPATRRALSAALARDAIAQGGVLFSALHRLGDARDDPVVMDAVAPLTVVDDSGTRVAGALVYRIDPDRYLFPLVRAWPTDSPSAETILVERDGDAVLYLNAVRHGGGGPLWGRAPLSDPDRVAAKAARGERGVVEGVSYRGVPVLAAVEEVEGSPWIMVSQIDRAEAYAPLRDHLWIYVAFLAAAAVSSAAVSRLRLRGVREEVLRREHEATKSYVAALEAVEAEREALIASLTRALDDVKTLRGIVPICASCKRVRDDQGYWNQVEAYVTRHTEAFFSHGVCPECAARLYPGLLDAPDEPASAPGPGTPEKPAP